MRVQETWCPCPDQINLDFVPIRILAQKKVLFAPPFHHRQWSKDSKARTRSCRPSFICPSHGVNALRCSPLCCARKATAHHRTSVVYIFHVAFLAFFEQPPLRFVQFLGSQTVELQTLRRSSCLAFRVDPVLYPYRCLLCSLLLVLSSVLVFGIWFHSITLLLGLVSIQSWRRARRECSSTFVDHRCPNLLIHPSYRCIATRGVRLNLQGLPCK